MAETTYKLVTVFAGEDGKNITMSYNYAQPNTQPSSVNAFMDAVIANKEIFARQPASKKSAKITATTETPVAIS